MASLSRKPLIRFYRSNGLGRALAVSDAARCLDVRLWRPGDRLVGPSAFMGSAYAGYLALHWFGVFASADYCAICIDEESGKPVHVSSVFPRFFRFPFMGRDDLQIGATFTSPAFRGRGLAHRALVEAVDQLAKPGRSFWYLSEASNAASCAVAEKAGFQLHGYGARFSRFGVGALGAYRLIHEETRVDS